MTANKPLKFLSVCSGIEAASVAWKPLGWQAVGFSEIEKFPSMLLKHYYPDVPNFGDFTKINVHDLGHVDILCGGTPCQAFSIAGLRNSLDDARGNLSLEFVRLAHELAINNGLRNVIWENVVGVLNTKDNAFGCFLGGLVGADTAVSPGTTTKWPSCGMVSGPKGRAAWCVKDAQYFGLAQRRRRVIVVADFGNGADPATVLFEPERSTRHSPPIRSATKDASTYVENGIGTFGKSEISGVLRSSGGSIGGGSETLCLKNKAEHGEVLSEIASCLTTREGQCYDAETTNIIAFEANMSMNTPTTNGVNPCITRQTHASIVYGLVARRLTPKECERLQGFPDNYTRIPVRHYNEMKITKNRPVDMWEKDENGGYWLMSSDGPRYKALGNSWAVPKFKWLGERIQKCMPK